MAVTGPIDASFTRATVLITRKMGIGDFRRVMIDFSMSAFADSYRFERRAGKSLKTQDHVEQIYIDI